jgi:hypothetical protein
MSFVSNLVGFTRKSMLPKVGKSDTYNMYVESKDAGEHAFTAILRPMPGYRLESSAVTGEPQGTYRCSRGYKKDGRPAVYGVWGRKLYVIMDMESGLVPYEVGSLAGSARCTFCETTGYGKAAPHLVICDGVNVYAVDTTLAPVDQRRDFKRVTMPLKYPDSTTERVKPSWVAYMYGYLLVGAAGTDMFYRSVQFPFEGSSDIMQLEETGGYGKWTFSEWQPDNTLAGCSTGSRLFTFGERSFQVFTFQDSIENPFASLDTAAQNIGIKSSSSLAYYGEQVFWLGSSLMGDGSVYMMGPDAHPTRISTDEIEDMMSRCDQRLAKGTIFKWKSHPMYVLDFPADDLTLVYDIRENGWVRMGSRKENGQEGCIRYTNAVPSAEGQVLLQGDGVLVSATDEKWDEHDGKPILRKRAGGILSSDYKPFKIGAIKLMTNNGDYPLTLGRAPQIFLRYSRDGATWMRSSTYSLGNAGRYDYDTVFRNLGKVQYLTVEVGTSENIGFALYGMDVTGTTCRK